MKPHGISQGFRLIWAIARKDIVDAIKNKTILGILIGVGFMMLSSQALSLLVRGRTEPSAIVYDAGESTRLREIVRSRELRIGLTASFDEMSDVIAQSVEPRLGIVLPAQFDAAVEGDDPIEVQGYTSHWLKPSQVADLVIYFEDQISSRVGQPIRILTPDTNRVYPDAEGFGFTTMVSSGIVLGVMTIGLIMVPILLIEEKETHTLDALLVSPVRPHHMLIGKALAGLCYAVTASVVIFIFSGDWIVHWWVIILAVILGALCAVVTGLLVGSIFENVTTVNLWIGLLIAFFLLPVFLWGSIAPKLPDSLQTIAQGSPSLAMFQMVGRSLAESATFGHVLPQVVVMVVFILLMSGLVVWRIRRSDR